MHSHPKGSVSCQVLLSVQLQCHGNSSQEEKVRGDLESCLIIHACQLAYLGIWFWDVWNAHRPDQVT